MKDKIYFSSLLTSFFLIIFLTSCGGGASCTKKTIKEDKLIQDKALEVRLSQQGVDFVTSHLKDLLDGPALSGAFKKKTDCVRYIEVPTKNAKLNAGNSSIIGGKIGLTDVTKVLIDVCKLSKGMKIDFQPNSGQIISINQSTGVYKAVVNMSIKGLRVGLDTAVFGSVKIGPFSSDAACPLKNGIDPNTSIVLDFDVQLAIGVDNKGHLDVLMPQINISNPSAQGANPRLNISKIGIGFLNPSNAAERKQICNYSSGGKQHCNDCGSFTILGQNIQTRGPNSSGNCSLTLSLPFLGTLGVTKEPACGECVGGTVETSIGNFPQPNFCGLVAGIGSIANQLLKILESPIANALNGALANVVGNLFFNQLKGQPLFIGGEIAIRDLLPKNLGIDMEGQTTNFGAGPMMNTGIEVLGSGAAKSLSLKMRMGMESIFSPCIKIPGPEDRLPPLDPNNAKGLQKNYGIGKLPSFPAGAYHFGAAMAKGSLNRALYEMYYGGNLCIGLPSDGLGDFIGTDISTEFIFGLTMPLLKKVVDRNSALYIQLKPKASPYINMQQVPRLDANGNPVKGPNGTVVNDAELTIVMPKMELGFYSLIEQRMARVFSSHFNMTLPLKLAVNGKSSLNLTLTKPIIKVTGGAEDYQEIVQGLDASKGLEQVMGILVGFVVGKKGGMQIPLDLESISSSVLGKKLTMFIEGVSVAGQNKDFLMFLLSLQEKKATPGGTPFMMTYEPDFRPNENSVYLPFNFDGIKYAEIEKGGFAKRDIEFGKNIPVTQKLPSGLLHIETPFIRYMEYSVMVDNTYWSHWAAGPGINLEQPLLKWPGEHKIQVRYRFIDEPWFIKTSDPFYVKIDHKGPEITIAGEDSSAQISVNDNLSNNSNLKTSYRFHLSGDKYSIWENLNSEAKVKYIEDSHMLEVESEDEVGNKTVAFQKINPHKQKKPSVFSIFDNGSDMSNDGEPQAGCNMSSQSQFNPLSMVFGFILLGFASLLRRKVYQKINKN